MDNVKSEGCVILATLKNHKCKKHKRALSDIRSLARLKSRLCKKRKKTYIQEHKTHSRIISQWSKNPQKEECEVNGYSQEQKKIKSYHLSVVKRFIKRRIQSKRQLLTKNKHHNQGTY